MGLGSRPYPSLQPFQRATVSGRGSGYPGTLAGSGRKWPEVAGSGRKWPEVAGKTIIFLSLGQRENSKGKAGRVGWRVALQFGWSSQKL